MSREPFVAPESATFVKWQGIVIFIAVVALIVTLYGFTAGFLATISGFGVVMFCVGAEAEERVGES